MPKVKLICTRHQDWGKCNSDELYNIFLQLNPDVIFEEKPLSAYKEFYEEKTKSGLESKAIIKYLKENDLIQVLVDPEIPEAEELLKVQNVMMKKIENSLGAASYHFCNTIDRIRDNIYAYGLAYLNSEQSSMLYARMKSEIENCIKILDNQNYKETYEKMNSIHDFRENKMIENIYKFTMENNFNMGIFLIGAAHRKAIIEKTKKYSESQPISIEWEY